MFLLHSPGPGFLETGAVQCGARSQRPAYGESSHAVFLVSECLEGSYYVERSKRQNQC